MLEINTAFEILPIKPGFNKKQVKKVGKKILARYHPDNVRNVNPKELKDILIDKYREIFTSADSTLRNVKSRNALYNSPEDYEEYKNSFKRTLNDLNKDKLIVILEANKLSTDGNKTQLKNRILENVPSLIAELNIIEHDLRKQYEPNNIKEILKRFRENKLVRILQLKNIQPNGNSTALINKIVSNISKNEINNLIDQVDREINDAKEKLNGLNDHQLKQILDNNKFDSKGEKPVLIKTILENVPIAEFDDNINIVCIKQKALKKLYSITGKDELLESYKQKLINNHLEVNHGIQIRNNMVSLIYNGQIEEDEIELKLDELIDEKSQEINSDVLDELYKITGKVGINSKFLKKLKQAGLDETDGVQIKNEIIADIKSGKVGKDNLLEQVNIKIIQKKLINEKLEILYSITGKTTLKSSFIQSLLNRGLGIQKGVQIKNEFISLIKTTDIDKNKIYSHLLEKIKWESSKKLINNCDISYLDQIAMMNNLSKCNTKEEYVESFLNCLSPFFTDFKIRSDISKIVNIKRRLVKLYVAQLEFILVYNNVSSEGFKIDLINNIISNIPITRINLILSEIEKTMDDLNHLTINELCFILKGNNGECSGEKTYIIHQINKTMPFDLIRKNIDALGIKQKALKKLYSITGKDELLESYKQKLVNNHLEINHGIQIRNNMVSLIYNGQIEEGKIELKLDELIDEKSQEINDDILDELYKITGKVGINSKFLKKLKQAGLDETDGVQIKNEIIADIKSWKIGKDNLLEQVNIKIIQKKLINEKLEILYSITGKTTLKSSFIELLSNWGLDEQDGVQIKNEFISLIKTTDIDKNKIRFHLLETIKRRSSKKLINNCDISYLDQIAMMNNLSKCNTKEEYVELFLNNLSPFVTDFKIKSDISKIDNTKRRLVKLYATQLEFILVYNNVSSEGIEDELINNIISNIPISCINLILSEIEKTMDDLNHLTINELCFVLNGNNGECSGGKTQVINKINKTMPVDLIKKNIIELNKFKPILNELNFNELKFIAKSNNLIVKDNKNQLIVEIGTQVPLNIISENILEINNIKSFVKSFNKLQRQHILKSNLLNDVGDDETQINKILENIDLFKIANFNKELNEIKYELNNLSVLQLNYILNNHNLEKFDNTSIQIETILENILMPFIKRDIQSIKELKNKIDAISEDEIDNILSKNKLRKSIHKNENIKTIVENLSFDKIKECLSGINNDAYLKELKNSTLICPIKISKGKKTFTTEKRGNSIFLLLFNNEELFNEYQQNNKSVKMLENNLDYFKKIINKNRKVEGILVKTPEEIIIRKD